MQLREIKTGTQMFLQLESKREQDPHFELTAKFETHDGEWFFSIVEPMWKGEYYTIAPDDTVHFRFVFEGMRYTFQGRVVGRYRMKQLNFLQLEQTAEIRELQQRSDFRLPVDDSAQITYTDENGSAPVEKREQVRLKDMSGGGAGFYTDQHPEKLRRMVMEIQTNTGVEKVGAEVRRAEEAQNLSGHRYLVGAQFNYQSDREKDRIIRHIFQLQQKRIKERGRKPPL